jgi:hypothetical protein
VIESVPVVRSSRLPIAPAVAWALELAILLSWLLQTPAGTLRAQLNVLQFWWLETCVFVGIACAAVVLRQIVAALDRRDAAVLALLATLAISVTIGVAPRTNRIFYDEQIYQNVGQNLADMRRAQLCNDGIIVEGRLRCFRAEYNKQPYAYPHLLSLAYRLFGVGPKVAFIVNAAAMGLTVSLLYLLVFILFSNRSAGFFAALLLALTPEQIMWSATAAIEPSASVACVAALLAAGCFVRWRSTASLIGTAVAAAYAVQFRPESFLIVPVIALLVWERAPEEFRRPRSWWAALLFLALTAAHLGHIVAVRNEAWGTTQARLSLAYVANNLRANTAFYLWDRRFPMTFTLFAIVGLIAGGVGRGRSTIIAYFALFFAMTLVFYAGSYDYGADVRYSLMTYPPLLILAGFGLAQAVRWMDRIVPRTAVFPAVVLLVGSQFAWGYSPVVRTTTDGAWAARADTRFAESLVPGLRGNSYVLTHNPGMFQIWGVNAGQMSLAAMDPAFLDDLTARFTGGVYLHWNFWCNVPDPVQHDFCTKILALRHGTKVHEYAERDQHFALFRLSTDP